METFDSEKLEELINEVRSGRLDSVHIHDFVRGTFNDGKKAGLKRAVEVNRLEVIDHTKGFDEGGGRAYVFRQEDKVNIEFSFQDGERTLKVFISPLAKNIEESHE